MIDRPMGPKELQAKTCTALYGTRWEAAFGNRIKLDVAGIHCMVVSCAMRGAYFQYLSLMKVCHIYV